MMKVKGKQMSLTQPWLGSLTNSTRIMRYCTEFRMEIPVAMVNMQKAFLANTDHNNWFNSSNTFFAGLQRRSRAG